MIIRMVSVASERCIGCGVCERVCPMGVFNIAGIASTDSEKCIYCKNCESICPAGCIYLKEAAEA